MKVETIAKWLISMWIAITLLSIGFATFARAQDSDWLPRRWKAPTHSRYYYPPRQRPPEVRSWRSQDESRCLGRLIAGTGQEATNEESALKSAERNWGALIRYDFGEKHMDLKFAERYSSRCQRSSTGESTTAKVLESVTGGNVGVLYRCRIFAEPCVAPKTTENTRDR